MLNKVALSLAVLYQFTSAQPPWIAEIQPAPPIPPNPQATQSTATPQQIDPAIPVIPVIPTQPTAPTMPTIPTIPNTPVIPVVLPSTTTTTTTSAPVIPVVLPSTTTTTTTTSAPVVSTTSTAAGSLPPGSFYGAYGQICGKPQPSSQCQSSTSSAYDREGFMRCDRNYDCCLCTQVTCNNCNTFSAGISGIFGVQDVQINGRDPQTGGADISCLGVESCAQSKITGQYIKTVTASGAMAARNAQIIITDPVEFFQIDCSAMGGCEDLNIELIYSGPPPGYECNANIAWLSPLYISSIHCSAQDSCKNMQLTVRNDACKRVIIQDLVCVATGACTNAAINLIGDVVIENCDLGPSGATMTGVDKCYENLRQLLCPDPRSCLGQERVLLNPVQGFAMKCGGAMSCAGARFTLELTNAYGGAMMGRAGGAIEHLDGFWFTGPYAAAGAVITIDNRQGGPAIVIERIECSTSNACSGTTFIIGANVNVNDIECSTSDSCRGCVIKYFASDPGMPCDPTQV
eukprot:140005_1